MAAVKRDELWADKHAPRSVNEMCYPAMANRLKLWMAEFPRNLTNPPPDFKRACLLSGPPGVGKTTTVHLVAAELGYQVVEFNASDHRSAKSLSQSVSDIVDNRCMTGLGYGKKTGNFFGQSAASAGADDSKLKLDKFVVLMDEVDGCDRGGVGEVIAIIKKTKVPVLCTCNDRWHQKLRSLINHVEDLKFSRPPFNVVANWITEHVLAREGCSVPKGVLQDVIKLEGNDIRSVLNNLQLWCRANKHLTELDVAKAVKVSYKNEDVGLFNAAETFLLQGSSQNAQQPRKTIEQLQSLYYSADLVDLFVQENYLHFKPERGDWMNAVTRAAQCISRADVVSRTLFVEQNWSVSTYHVLSGAIAPCAYTRGHYQTFLSGPAAGFDRSRPVKFPAWLGSNSTTGKNTRLSTCVAKQGQHPTTGLTGSAEDVVQDYCPVLAGRLTQPLQQKGKEGIPEVIATMDSYKMQRDDYDFVMDVTRYKKLVSPGAQARITAQVPTAVKSAFTRTYNATHKADRMSFRAKLGVVPDARPGDDDDDDEEGDEAGPGPAKKNRAEGPAPPAAGKGKKKAAAAAGTAPAKPRAKKAAKGASAAPAAAPSAPSSKGPVIIL